MASVDLRQKTCKLEREVSSRVLETGQEDTQIICFVTGPGQESVRLYFSTLFQSYRLKKKVVPSVPQSDVPPKQKCFGVATRNNITFIADVI